MGEHPIENLMMTAMSSLRDMIDVNTIVGELVDVDGICGGYNLHWAWCSGITAGEAAAEYIAHE